jgi:hypothetical protein
MERRLPYSSRSEGVGRRALLAGGAALALCWLQVDCAMPARAGVLLHSHTMEFNNDGTPPYPGQDWALYVAPYIDLDDTSGALQVAARAAGIATAFYFDVNHCSGTGSPFQTYPNAYAAPDCSTWDKGGPSTTAFYAQNGVPANILSVGIIGSAGTGVLQQILDPSTSSAQSLTSAAEKAVVLNLSVQWHSKYNAALLDDVNTMDEDSWEAFCWGTGTFRDGAWSCAGSPGGSAISPWSSTYSRNKWIAGMETIVGDAPLPQILNGLNGTDPVGGVAYAYPASAQVIADSPNAWGGACENCFYQTSSNHWLVANVVIDHFLNGLMHVISSGKNAIVMNDSQLDPTSRQYAMAISMLAYDPTYMWYFGNPCGQISKVNACPEAALTFYSPYRSYPKSVSDVTLSSGAYMREFAACYSWGQALGPCAAVVNPQPYYTIALPKFNNTYVYTLSLAASKLGPPGLCNCFGESNVISVTGKAAPNPMPELSSYVLFTSQAEKAAGGRGLKRFRRGALD